MPWRYWWSIFSRFRRWLPQLDSRN